MPTPTLNPDALRGAVACLKEIATYRARMDPGAFAEFPHGQLLAGYIRGVAAGAGIGLEQLLALAEAAGDTEGKPLWTCLS